MNIDHPNASQETVVRGQEIRRALTHMQTLIHTHTYTHRVHVSPFFVSLCPSSAGTCDQARQGGCCVHFKRVRRRWGLQIAISVCKETPAKANSARHRWAGGLVGARACVYVCGCVVVSMCAFLQWFTDFSIMPTPHSKSVFLMLSHAGIGR